MTDKKKRSFLDAEVREDAKAIGARRYVNGDRYKAQRDRIFEFLDSCVEYLAEQGFGNEHSPTALGSFATAIISADDKARGALQKAKVKGMADAEKRKELFRLIGLLVADDYLKSLPEVPKEPRLSLPKRALSGLTAKLHSAAELGAALSEEDHYKVERAVRFETENPLEVAEAMMAEALAEYESLIPEAEGEGEVPDLVERRAIGKAALMRLHVDHLEEEAVNQGFDDLPSKEAMATAIAEKYADEIDTIAEIVLRREKGDPEYGLVTRLVPLRDAPLIGAAEHAFNSLQGRYIEARAAAFYIFGRTERSGDILTVHGKIRSFTVNPSEAGGEAHMNPRPFNDDVVIVLRKGSDFAEVNTRRVSDLVTVRSVLRRTGEMIPAAVVPVPARLTSDPYKDWDPRTLWMLDFLRRDLRSDELKLQTMLMANFLAPDKADEPEEEEQPETEAPETGPRQPSLDAVRLLGYRLQDHPEACQRIVSGSRLRDVDIQVRNLYDRASNYAKFLKFRLSWENDHFAVLSGAVKGRVDSELHRMMVRLVRKSVHRQLSENALDFTLRRIARIAESGEFPDDGEGALDADDAAASGPQS